MRLVQLVNQSTLVKPADLEAWRKALQIQIWRDFTPAWLTYAELSTGTTPDPAKENLFLFDDATVADALGYHDLDQFDKPVGFVFVKPTLDAGDKVSATISHELLEMLGDPWINLSAQGTYKGKPADFALENCDPVENDEYQINGVAVSNFVLPTWFQGKAAKYDHMGKLSVPFSLSAGGYMSYATAIGRWQQVFGKHAPNHQRTPTKYSRRDRRFT